MADGYFNERTVNRRLLIWAIGCRRQLDRWKPLVAAFVRSQLNGPPFPDALNWEAQIEHHFLSVAARNLIRAIDPDRWSDRDRANDPSGADRG